MTDRDIHCRLRLSHTDLVMQNHRVHGVAVLPGVVLLETALRVLSARGHDPAGFALERILFTEPIVTDPSMDRELRVDVCLPLDNPGSITVQSRPWGSEVSFKQSMQAVLVNDRTPPKPNLDVAARKAACGAGLAMAELYRRARLEQIDHGPKMRCLGQLWVGAGELVAELQLEVPGVAGFYMHPAAMDATTIAAFGQTEQASRDPFIPVTIDRFRVVRGLPERFVLHAPRTETLAATGDVIWNDYDLYDTDGRYCASFKKLTCKLIRQPELITRLLHRVPVPAVPAPVATMVGAPPSAGQASSYVDLLRSWIAEVLGVERATIRSDVGFYELGLDSRAMLGLAERLEEIVGADIYPTLLFEHSDIGALDAHLVAAHGPLAGRPASSPSAAGETHVGGERQSRTAGGGEVVSAPLSTLLASPGWVYDQRPREAGRGPRRILAVGLSASDAEELRKALGGSRQILPCDREPSDVVRAGNDAADGALIFLSASAEPPEATLTRVMAWTRAAATAGRTFDILVVERGDRPSAALQGLGAFARSVRAETPRVFARVLFAHASGWVDEVVGELERTADELPVTASIVSMGEGGRPLVQVLVADQVLEPGAGAALPLPPGAVCVISGGTGGIGALMADWLVAEIDAKVILFSRSGPAAGRAEQWARHGGRGCFEHHCCDVTDLARVRTVLDDVRRRHGSIDAVFHAAGALADGLHFTADAAQIQTVVAPKLAGFRVLDEATSGDNLRLIVAFSSLAAWRPNPGQGVYAFANAVLEGLVAERNAKSGRRGRAIAIAWPLWSDGGMKLTEVDLAAATRRTGAWPLPTAIAMRCLKVGATRDLSSAARRDGTMAVLHGDAARLSAWISPASDAATPVRTPAPVIAEAVRPAVASRQKGLEIAIVGLAGRYPGAGDVDELWEKLCAGYDAISEVPVERWDHAAIYDPQKGTPGKTYGRWGGFLADIDAFDAGLFNVSRRDAERMDPQERLFLETCWTLLEEAGHPTRTLEDRDVGIFAGVMWNHYQLCGGESVAPTAMHAAIANRVSFALDLHGPSMAVDTACSSSLTAFCLAVDAIRSGACSMAIAGGVNLSVHPEKYRQLAMGQFLSDDGRCRSFGDGGTGYVPGEGVGAVLLRPLADALAAGDHIWGTVKASAVNHAGRTSGFTVPSPAGQAAVIRRVLQQSQVAPASIAYVEAHGTGTALGDPIEIEGLARALGTDARKSIPIGSIKSNVGHLEGAAGIAALTKVLLMMRERTLVPSLHADRPNPALRLSESGFHVQKQKEPWGSQAAGEPLRAAISAFGAGGSNACVIVDEGPPLAPSPPDAPSVQVLLLSARDNAGIREYARRMSHALASESSALPRQASADVMAVVADLLNVSPSELRPEDSARSLGLEANDLLELKRRARLPGLPDLDMDLAQLAAFPAQGRAGLTLRDVAYTLQMCRTHLDQRLAVVVSSLAEAAGLLAAFADGQDASRDAPVRVLSTKSAGSAPGEVDVWAQGGAVDFAGNWLGQQPRRVHLPVAGLRRDRFWIGAWQAGKKVRLGLEGSAADGSTVNGSTVNGSTVNGSTVNGSAADGSTVNGSTVNGSAAPAALVPISVISAMEDTFASRKVSRGSDIVSESVKNEAVVLKVLVGGVALVQMQDGANHNMFTAELLAGLESSFAAIAARDDVRAVVLTGTDKVFSMGGTPSALERLARKDGRFTDVPFIYEGLARCKIPVVAAVRGHASGGGLAFGLHADQVILDRDGLYSANFVKFGFTPGLGATYALERRFGAGLAAEMCLTGSGYSGRELEEMRVPLRFADSEEVLPTALRIASAIAGNTPEVVSALKANLSTLVLEDLASVIEREIAMHEQVLDSSLVDRIRSRTMTAPSGPAPSPNPVAPGRVAGTTKPSAEVVQRIRAKIEDVLCLHLSAERDELDSKRTFSEMGLDSLGVVEIVRDLNQAFTLTLDSVLVYDHPTIDRLVEAVVATVNANERLVSEALSGPAVPAADTRVDGPPRPTQTASPVESASRASAPAPRSAPVPLASAPVRLSAPVSPASAPASKNARASTAPLPLVGAQPTAPAGPGPLRLLSPLEVRPELPIEKAKSLARPLAGSVATKPVGADDDIAIVGMSARYPGAKNVDELWDNLVNGRFTVTEVTPNRWDVARFYDPDQHAPGKTTSKWAGLVSDVDRFDAAFFGISPREAELTDPQQRVFLEQAWRALEHAGYAVGPDRQVDCGVFVGTATGDYLQLLREAGAADSGQVFIGNSGSILAARIAYFLNLSGPTVALDTACSSSLVALHLACLAIRAGDCEMALAGGVALMLTPQMHIWNGKSGMLSPRGRCAAFDASADGFVLGEGVGAVVVKRLSAAIADRDQIHAVIKASGINGDGKSNGITAPSAAAQVRLLERVHARSGVSADDLAYIETHGAGTQIGDPIELKALSAILRGRSRTSPPCGIGSIKSNIGHTTLAGGVAGLLKVVLGLKHREIPPSLHFERINPNIDLASAPIEVITERRPWPTGPSGRRFGALNSFGVSGTNAHFVIAEAPAPEVVKAEIVDEAYLLPVSAKTPAALRQMVEGLRADLLSGAPIADVAFTLGVGRCLFRKRFAVVAKDVSSAIALLSRAVEADSLPEDVVTDRPRLGGDRREIEPSRFDRPLSMDDLTALAAGFLGGTDVDFAALFARRGGRRVPLSGYALADRRFWVPQPDQGVSASRREESAVAVAGVREVSVDLRTQWSQDHRVRGQRLVPGAAVIHFSTQAHPSVAVTVSEIEWSRPARASEAERLQIRYSTDATGRCTTELRLGDQDWCARAVVASRGEARDDSRLDVNLVAARCSEEIGHDALYRTFADAGIEYGPSFRRVDRVLHGRDAAVGWLRPLTESENAPIQTIDAVLQVTAALEYGTELVVPRRIERVRISRPVETTAAVVVVRKGEGLYDLTACDATGAVTIAITGFRLAPLTSSDTRLYGSEWQKLASVSASAARARRTWLRLASANPVLPDGIAGSELVIDARNVAEDSLLSALQLLRLRLSELGRRHADDCQVVVITAGAVDVTGDEKRSPIQAAICGFARSAAAEYPSWALRVLDVELNDELSQGTRLPTVPGVGVVACRAGSWYERKLALIPAGDAGGTPFREGLVYLIVGGAGGLGFALSKELATRHHARIGWIGRRAIDARVREKMAIIENLGGKVHYETADVGDLEALKLAVRAMRRALGPISGAVHSAMVLDDVSIARMTEVDLDQVLHPKVAGLRNLHRALEGEPIDHLILFSSAASILDSPGQANYAAASCYLDAYGLELRRRYGVPTYVVNWGYWGSIGVVAGGRYAKEMATRGVGSIEPEDGFACLRQQMMLQVPQALVLNADRRRFADYGLKLAGETGNELPIEAAAPAALKVAGRKSAANGVAAEGADAGAVIAYVQKTFARVLKMAPEDLDVRETFESFGVDSLLGMDILRCLKEDLGPLPSTLLYERLTIAEIADFLRSHHRDAIRKVVSSPAGGESRANAAEPGLEPAVAVGNGQIARAAAPPSGYSVPQRTTAPTFGGEGTDAAAVTARVRKTFARVLKMAPEELDVHETFESFGVDSLLGMDILRYLKEDLGPLPSTLLYERLTIAEIADYVRHHHSDALSNGAPLPSGGEKAARSGPLERASAGAAATAEVVRVEPTPRRPASDTRAPASTPTTPRFDRVEREGASAAFAQGRSLSSPRATGSWSGEKLDPEAIAIVGITGRYPGSPDLEAFWDNLRNGRRCTSEVPAERWDWRPFFDADRKKNRTYNRWGGFISGVDLFDPQFFGILPSDAAAIDPQERLFLEACWDLLEQAGHNGTGSREAATGVFVGVMYGSYGQIAAAQGWSRGEFGLGHSSYWSIANRVSYQLDLTGPSLAVDTACSSSLTALHLACESLRRGECRMAIAGGVNLILHPAHHIALSAMNMLGSGTACHTFDAMADGIVPGEGVGAVLLRPLADALADGDEIWAVIRGSMINAGGKTAGFTVPSPNAQADVIRRAIEKSGVPSAAIGYVEVHGTGTQLGDPIEVAALNEVFRNERGERPVLVGSVKANIGHLEGAAGIAGVTKAVLQLRHSEIAPCAGLSELNAKIDFSGPVQPVRELQAWQRAAVDDGFGAGRAVGVSSFGAGGANAHVILHGWEDDRRFVGKGAAPPSLFVLSARTHEQLRKYAASVSEWLSRHPDADLLRLCFTSQVGRRQLAVRSATLATSVVQLVEALRGLAGSETPVQGAVGRIDAHTVVSPLGDRASMPFGNLGAELVELLIQRRRSSELAEAWVRGLPVAWPSLWDERPGVCSFPTVPLDRRRFWLPAPVEETMALARGPRPIDGWMEALAADHCIQNRHLVPGAALLDVMITEIGDQLPLVVRDVRWLHPVEIEGDGPQLEVEREANRIKLCRRGRLAPLAVVTMDAAPVNEPAPLDLSALRGRCSTALDGESFYARMTQGGFHYGPSLRSLQHLMSGADLAVAELDVSAGAPGRRRGILVDGAMQAVSSLAGGEPAVPVGLGVFIQYAAFPERVVAVVEREAEPLTFKIRVCTDSGRVVAELGGLRLVSTRPSAASASAPLVPESERAASTEYLRPMQVPAPREAPPSVPERVVVVGDDSAQRSQVVRALEKRGSRRVVSSVEMTIDSPTDAVVMLLSRSDADAEVTLQSHLLKLRAVAMWGKARSTDAELRLLVVGDSGDSAAIAVAAATRTLALEHVWVRATHLLLDDPRSEGAGAAIAEELVCASPKEPEVRLQGFRRTVRQLQPFVPTSVAEPLVRLGGVYVITGGAGGLGRLFAEHLLDMAPVTVVLVGRSPASKVLLDWMDSRSVSGRRLVYVPVDVADFGLLRATMIGLADRHGPIRGVIHAAGLQQDALAAKKSDTSIAEVLRPKVRGVASLDAATADQPLDFFLVCSSLAAETGNIGQFDYTAANRFLVAFGEERQQRRVAGQAKGSTIVVEWPLWADGNMTVDHATLRLFAQRFGMVPLPSKAGLAALDLGLAGEEQCFAVVQRLATQAVSVRETTPIARAATTAAPATILDLESLRTTVAAALQAIGASYLLVDPSEVDLDAELSDLGFNSISLTDLVNKVNERYGLDLLPTVLFEFPTLAGFAAYLAKTHGPEVALKGSTTALEMSPRSSANGVLPVAEDDFVPVAKDGFAPSDEMSPGAAPASSSADGREKASTAEPVRVVRSTSEDRSVAEPIAIVGIAGRLAAASSVQEFWDALLSGRELIGGVGADRDALRRDPATADVKAGFLADVGSFDAAAFGISPREAALMDPQQRLFMETVSEAIQDAGHAPDAWAGRSVGVFAGVSTSDYDTLMVEAGVRVEPHMATGIAHSILANRVSHFFDWRGPSEVVDTACSSSLVALHRAVRALRGRECDVALVGGVNVTLAPGLFRAFNESGMLSPGHACRSFDSKADGYVRGEGVGAVVLRPLSQALADGDHVYALVLGSAVNHCGKSASLTAPNPAAQADVIERALADAAVDPRSISFIETHGTGTRLGDPIEIEGLKQAYARACDKWSSPPPVEPWIALGAVKTVVGHLEAASGIAGLLRTVLSLEHGQLTPNRNYSETNPYVRIERSPFHLLTVGRQWRDGEKPRRAAVSSFGFGGTNAHVVLEAGPSSRGPNVDSGAESGWRLFPLSAPSREQLCRSAAALADRIVSSSPASADVAFTLQRGRAALPHRVVILAKGQAELVDVLRAVSAGKFDDRSVLTRSDLAPASAADQVQLAERWLRGDPAAWPEMAGRRISLPAVPFARSPHWFKAPQKEEAISPAPSASPKSNPRPFGAVPEEAPLNGAMGVHAGFARASVSPGVSFRDVLSGEPTTVLQMNSASSTNGATRHVEEVAVRGNGAPSRLNGGAGSTRPRGGVSLTPLRQAAPVARPVNVPRRHTVSAVPTIEQRPGAVGFIVGQLATILLMPADRVDASARFDDLGLDSIFRLDLIRSLNQHFGLDLKGADLYDVTSAAALGALIDSLVGAASAELPAPSADAPSVPENSQGQKPVGVSLEAAPVASVPVSDAPLGRPAPVLARPGASAAADVAVIVELVAEMLGRQIAENVSFADGGMTSFDMLRVIARLESAVGHLPKALLFDQPTCRDLALWLEIRFGAGVFGELHGNASPTTEATGADRPTEILPDGAVVVAKHRLSEHPDVAAALVQIEAKWAKEGGLPGRDIAPLVFLDSRRAGYLNFSERDGIVLAWSCAVAEEDFHALVGEWVKWAAARNLRPNFLSMLPVEEVAGVPFCSTPFGTVQRLHGIGSFSLEGGQMQRLRQKVQKFERSGTVRVDEYPMGSDSAIDARIVSLIDQWAARKDMVNPYVETVRSEVAQGIMADRHRVYLTVVDDEIVAAVVITKIPSENGYLLDLEFFGDKMTDGGLDYTIVQILKRLAAEGCDTFSFGATLGVVVGASKNPHPAVAKILQELRDAGLFRGDGNFQFKNKYRPKNLLVYLCQPATASPADVSSVILLIANPTIVKKPKALSATPAPERLAVAPVVVEPAQPPVRFIERVLSESPRQGDLRQVGWNPLALPRMAGASEMVTDSWAERDEPAIADRARELAEMGTAICGELIDQTTLPFTYVQATPSGRAAEATLLRALGPKRTIIQTNLFPSWMYNALDLGYRPVVVRTRTGTGDVDLDHLKEVIAANAGTVGLCCVELASNASGGRPLSLQNAIGISEATRAAGIPLVFDAARGIDNACAIADAEGRDLWSVVRELFSLATAITLSMPKNFGVTSGGLVATSDPAITRALRQRVADRGQEVSSAERRLLAAALGDRPWVEAQSRKRIRHTEMLAARLRASGAPVRASGGHAVLLDAAQMCGKRFAHPMASALAWLYETAGVRAAPHLAAGMPQTESCIRLAVPVGLADSELERVADELSRAFGGAARPADLLRLPDGGEGPAFYQPREQVPDDVAEDIERGKPIARTNENWAVVSDWQPSAVRRIVPHEGGEIEVFEAGHGPPVVFLHPFNIGLGFFAPQMRDLASTHRVIGIHAPGVGATVNIADLSFAGLARAVVAGVRGIGVTGRFFVAGASFGGLTALSVAHRHPDDVAGLILLGSSYRVGNRKGDVNRLAVVAREDFDALSAAGVQPTSPPREELEGLLLRCESIDPKIGLRYLDQFAERPDLLSDAATLAVPTLIMHGVHDTVIKLEVAQLLHRTIPGANFVEIADAGHFPSLTSADQVNALIAGFTKGIQSK